MEVKVSADTIKRHNEYNNKLFKSLLPIYDYVELLLLTIRPYLYNRLALPENSKILDVACGTGFMTSILAKKGYKVSALDISPDMLDRAKERLKNYKDIAYYKESATELPFDDSYFDAASVSFALHDMPQELGLAVIKEMTRVTKKEGKIFILDYSSSKSLTAFLGQNMTAVWESIYYRDFLKTGIGPYLDYAGLKIESRKEFLFSNVEFLICSKL